jgi:hypothetical protein
LISTPCDGGNAGGVADDGDGAGDAANESNGEPANDTFDEYNGDGVTAGGNALIASLGVAGGDRGGVGDEDNGIFTRRRALGGETDGDGGIEDDNGVGAGERPCAPLCNGVPNVDDDPDDGVDEVDGGIGD